MQQIWAVYRLFIFQNKKLFSCHGKQKQGNEIMAMKAIHFTKQGLADFQATADIGEEAKDINDKRRRCWNRTKGVSLGFELHDRGKPKRQVIGLYGDITLTQYKQTLNQLIAEGLLNKFRPPPMTFSQYFETTFINFSKRHHKNQKSVNCNYNRLSDEFKSKELSQITRGCIESELNRIAERGLANASLNRVLALIRKMLNLALADQLIEWSGAQHVKALKEDFKPSISLSDAEYRRYVELAFEDGDTVRAMALVLAATTGCRIGEIMGIHLKDISVDGSSFLIRNTKNGDSREVYVGKTGSKAIATAMELSFNEFLFSSDRSKTGFIGYPRGVHERITEQLDKEF